MRSVFSAFFALGFVLCCSADAFQKTCAGSYKPGGSATSHGKARRRTYFGSQVKHTTTPRPGFYGVKTASIDVVVMAQAADITGVYIDGRSDPSAKSSCDEPASVPLTLYGGEIISFNPIASDYSTGQEFGFFAAILSADGSQVYATTGQAGWKVKNMDDVTQGWMQPGYDDSDWESLSTVDWTSDCNIDPFDETGAVCTWLSTYPILAVRYKVPKIGCECTEGACVDGYCNGCLYHQGGGREVCEDGWAEDVCVNAGSSYVWCGDS